MSSNLSKGTIGVFLFILSTAFFITPQAAYADAPCHTYTRGGSHQHYFESYESSEYIDGHLVLHFRLQNPYVGIPIRFRLHVFREFSETDTCNPQFNPGFTQIDLSPGIRNWSIRFVSPTRYEIWNDETNAPETCSQCVGDIGFNLNDVKEIAVEGFIFDGLSDQFFSTSFSPIEPAPPVAECCSSVAFLPGLLGSRLYSQETLLGVPFENRLWEPISNADVDKLALSPITGESLNPDIYTRDAIDDSFGLAPLQNIYKGFIQKMEALSEEGAIGEFSTLPYDWRMDVRVVATQPIRLENSAYLMMEKIREMASSSPTGKVTLITHSNGGLVAKALLTELEERDEAGLIDRMIMVAAPQLGTPEGILESLHGMSLFLGFPDPAAIREVAENMHSAYTLVPSREYFNRVATTGEQPIIEFSTTTPLTQELRDTYGTSIATYDELREFILGSEGRSEPARDDVNLPNVLKENFLQTAEVRHESLDTWVPPQGIEVTEIVGWGLQTVRGITYSSAKKRVCAEDLSACVVQKILDPQPLTTEEGDGTVVYPSAGMMGSGKYFIDIFNYNKPRTNVNRDHKNILEIEPLQDLIAILLQNQSTSTLPAFISTTKPAPSSKDTSLSISVHSPVELHLYDADGRHTGPIPNPNPNSDLSLYEEQIPNSHYWRIGEGQYAGVATSTTIHLEGVALGTFTLEIKEISGDDSTGMIMFSDIPVTASSTASLTLSSLTDAPLLALDVDGNGEVDVNLSSTEGISEINLVYILRGIIHTLDLPTKKKNALLKSIDKVLKVQTKEEVCNEKGKEKQTERCKTNKKKKLDQGFENLIKSIEKMITKGQIDRISGEELITFIEEIKRGMVG